MVLKLKRIMRNLQLRLFVGETLDAVAYADTRSIAAR